MVRIITPEVIKEILAKPCRMGNMGLARATKYYELLCDEKFLLEDNYDMDDNVLKYRTDLRRLMLPLVLKKESSKSREISELAIQYYKGSKKPADIAEYIYHNLLLGNEPSSIKPLLNKGLQIYLEQSLEELPLEAHIYLANYFDINIPEEIIDKADLVQWEKRQAKELNRVLNSGNYKSLQNMEEKIDKRKDRSEHSELTLPEAKLLFRLSKVIKSKRLAEIALIQATNLNDIPNIIDATMLLAHINERNHNYYETLKNLSDVIKILVNTPITKEHWNILDSYLELAIRVTSRLDNDDKKKLSFLRTSVKKLSIYADSFDIPKSIEPSDYIKNFSSITISNYFIC